jgi:hypothetical protein
LCNMNTKTIQLSSLGCPTIRWSRLEIQPDLPGVGL